MKIQFIKSSEKKQLIKELNERFGIEKIPYLLIRTGKERIRAFSGNLAKEEILQITSLTNLETIGLYILRKEKENDIRLTIDGAHLLKDQLINNIVEINESQLNEWIKGFDLEISAPKGNVLIKHKSDFIGCGKSNSQKIFNYLPKDRRRKK